MRRHETLAQKMAMTVSTIFFSTDSTAFEHIQKQKQAISQRSKVLPYEVFGTEMKTLVKTA